ncbi:methyltransferase domain-containing protein [bacterium]|nr:methyltransferase domain-containing protein [bacterium]
MTDSRRVDSSQTGVHLKLEAIVRKHLSTQFERPIADHTRRAFDSIYNKLQHPKLIFDTGCGTGDSTIQLALRHPDAQVIGIDKSIARLSKHPIAEQQDKPKNYELVQAELIDFWRLAVDAKLQLWRHCFFYPNPWPKPGQLQRRWHASAVFPSILRLGGDIELRSNWRIYLEEFQYALRIAGRSSNIQELTQNGAQPISAFEKKYWHSGQRLWQLLADAPDAV